LQDWPELLAQNFSNFLPAIRLSAKFVFYGYSGEKEADRSFDTFKER
jgi:hypothetical protein